MRGRLAAAVWVLAAQLLSAQAEDPGEASHRARQMMAMGRFAEAASVYEKILQAMPGNTGIRLNLAIALHMAGQDGRAIPHFEAVLKQQPQALPALMLLGASYLRTGQPGKAAPLLSRAVALAPDDMQGRSMLVDALLMLDRPAAAIPHLKKLTLADAQNPRVWYGLGRAYEALAQQSFERLEREGLGSPWWLYLSAEARLKLGRYTAAYALLKAATEKAPQMRGVHALLAEVYRKTGHAGWAAVEEGLERKAPAPDCGAPSAECYFRQGRMEQALAVAQRRQGQEALFWQIRAANELARRSLARLERLPASVEGHQVMAELFRNQGRHADAIAEWKKALDLAPGDPRLEEELLTSTYQNRDYVTAEQMARALLRRSGDSAELHFILGDSLLNQQKVEEAVAELERAAALRKDYGPAHAELGRGLMQLGQAEKAVPHLEAALAIDTDGSLYVLLSRAYQAAGRRQEAAELLKKYQEARKAQPGEEIAIGPPPAP